MTVRNTDRRGRTAHLLTGTWTFRTDPGDVGREEGWHQPAADWSDAETVDIPHVWQERDDLREYTGVAWYRRTIEVDKNDLVDARAHLQFDAVDYETTVWLNGEELGTNRGGYLPFSFDVSAELSAGENAVVARVRDPDDLSEIPHGKQGDPWYTRVSGIWGDVRLTFPPATFVDAARVTPDLSAEAAQFDLRLDAPSDTAFETFDVEVVVKREGASVATATAAFDGDKTATTVEIPDPDYWTPENPALYDFEVRLKRGGRVVDRYEDYFGMRSVSTDGDRLLLNGEPLFVRGALDQGYYPKTLYRPFDDDLFEREIQMAKELGFNLLRKHIKPAHPNFVELADRLGLLVWEEPANPTVHTERSKREVREQIWGLIDRDYNRPSVVIWSLYNEEWGIGNPQGLDEETSLWDDEDKQEYLADLYERVKVEDPTRLVCDNSGWAHVATDLNDYHKYVVSPDRVSVWDDELDELLACPEKNYARTETDPGDAPVVISEFGTWGMVDPVVAEAWYEGEPPWFHHSFLADYDYQGEMLKRPAGVRDRFKRSHAASVFGEFDELARAWQTREQRSNADLIGRMRSRPGIAGYVITEFSDIEWECNGVLDYFRNPKAFHDEFAQTNADLAVTVEPSSPTVWAGSQVWFDVVLSNHAREPVDGVLHWTAFGEEGSVDVDVEEFETRRIDAAFAAEAPPVDDARTEDVGVTLSSSDRTVAADSPVTVVAPAEERLADESTVTLHVEHPSLRSSLIETEAFEIVDDPVNADVVVTTELSEAVEEHAVDGGSVLLVPDADGAVVGANRFSFRKLPPGESWHLVAGLFYQDTPLLDGLVDGYELGRSFEGLYPYAVVTDVEAEVGDGEAEADDVTVGYAEGWMANRASPLLTRSVGAGSVTICTFRVAHAYGENPVATAVLDRLLARGETV